MAKRNPTVIINEYLERALPQVLPDLYGSSIPSIRPSKPEDIDSYYNNTTTLTNGTALGVAYERMFKLRRGAFPHCKCEQVLYYLYAVQGDNSDDRVVTLIENTQAIFDLLDRGDESAQEINAWQDANLNAEGELSLNGALWEPYYFHEFKIFQLEEGRDLIDFATVEGYLGNKIIIDYEYHAKDFNNAQPFVVS